MLPIGNYMGMKEKIEISKALYVVIMVVVYAIAV